MATAKKPAKFPIKIGHVTVRSEKVTNSGEGKTKYRIECTKAIVPKDFKRRTRTNLDEALKIAAELNAAIESDRANKYDPDENQEIREIAEQFRITKVLEKGNSDYWGHETTYRNIFDLGALFFQAMQSNNAKREKNGLGKNMLRSTLREFKEFLDDRSDKVSAPTFKDLIEICIAEKTGKHGGAGNRELEPSTKNDWKLYVGQNLAKWIGHFSSTEERKLLIKAVRDGLNKGAETRKGRETGKPWSDLSKWKRAKKVSEFAKWCVEHEEEYLKVNPFRSLPKKFKPTYETRAKIYQPSQVGILFKVLASNERYKRMIPYYALCFFAGLRPSEAAYPANAKRRLQWEVFNGWKNDSDVTMGKRFEVVAQSHLGKRKSKSNIDRTADLPPNGVAWIKFAMGELPTDGEVYYNRDIVKAARIEAGLWGKNSKGIAKWIDDGARHSMTTYADNNANFNANTTEYWRDCCGHTDEVFKRDYRGRVDGQSVKSEYFNIMPPEGEESDWPNEEETKQFAAEFKK